MLAERIGSAQLADLAAAGAGLAGVLRAGELPRLAALLARGAEGRLDVSLGFRNGPESHPVVEIRVSGSLPLVCQRCLGAVPWVLDLEVALTAVPDEAAAEGLADPFDSVLLDADGGLPVRVMVEDEILAMLPLAPLHAVATDCRPAEGVPLGPAAGPATPARVNRPFAGLGALLGEGSKGKK